MFPMMGGGMPGGMFGGMGGLGMLGGGMFGGDDEEKKKRGMLGHMGMGLGLIPSAFMSGHPNIGLGMISPMLGGMRALGLFK